VHDRLDLWFEALGALELKNIARPIEAFLLRLEPGESDLQHLSAEPRSHNPAKLPRLSVMMTLLKDQGVPKELDYLVESITEDLATDLSQYLGYSVVIGAPEATASNSSDLACKSALDMSCKEAWAEPRNGSD
jgi:hypothetical protein